MNPWFLVDVKLPKHAKMAGLPNDTARWGWIATLAEAKQQTHPGSFASARHYCEVMGRFGRYLGDYIKADLMDRAEDGTLSIHDWRQYQYNVSKQRQRQDKSETSRGHDVDTKLTKSALTETETKTETFKSLKRPITRVETQPQRLADLLPRNYVAELRKMQAE